MRHKIIIGADLFNLTYEELTEIIKSVVALPHLVKHPQMANSVSYEDEVMNLFIENFSHGSNNIPTKNGRKYSLGVEYYGELTEAKRWINQIIELLNKKSVIYAFDYGVGNEQGEIIGEEFEILHPLMR